MPKSKSAAKPARPRKVYVCVRETCGKRVPIVKGKRPPAYCNAACRHPKVACACSRCGSVVMRSPSEVEPHVFCDVDCYARWREGRPRIPREDQRQTSFDGFRDRAA